MSEYVDTEEATLLGAVLSFDSAVWPEEILETKETYFNDPGHQAIFQAVYTLIEGKNPVDVITVNNELKKAGKDKMLGYLNQLVADCAGTANLSHWLKILNNRGKKQELDDTIISIIMNYEQGADPDDVIGDLLTEIKQHQTSDNSQSLKSIRGVFPDALAEIEIEYKNPNDVVIASTGIKALDRNLKLKAGHLTIIAGRPSMGKSAFAGNIAAHCAKNKGVTCFFSLEMDTISIVRRILAAEMKISDEDLVAKVVTGEVAKTMNDLSQNMELYIDDRPNMDLMKIETALLRVKEPKLVIVDYLQLAKLSKSKERHDIKLGELSRGLKCLAKEFNCHVIALSQLNRNVEYRKPPRPILADLKNSGDIEQDADNVVMLYRPSYYYETEPPDLAEVIIAKQRHGKTLSMDVRFIPGLYLFGDKHE